MPMASPALRLAGWGSTLLLLLLALIGPGCGASPARPAQQQAGTPALEDSPYVGVEICRTCHPSAWRVWVSSRHARSSVALHTERAWAFAARANHPGEDFFQDPICLGCHGVGLVEGQRPTRAEAGYHPAEGVTCEACHGPGGRHVAAAQDHRTGPELLAGLRAEVRACLDCHKDKPSHAHELRIPYDPEKFAELIKHGKEPPPEAGSPASSPGGK